MPEGSLPVFSVDTEDEAKMLLVMTCPKNMSGQFVARQLATKQTLDNLAAFSDQLKAAHDMLVKNGTCKCKKNRLTNRTKNRRLQT